MKHSRWLAVAAAMAVVVLIAPAIGAGKGAAGALAWSQGGVTTSSFVFSTVASGSHGSRSFRLTNWGRHASGRFAIHLTGSPAFSIGSTGCARKLGARKSCRVSVVYAPSQAGARDHAVLTATREHRAAATLNLSGCSVDASGTVYWVTSGDYSGSVKEGLFAAGCPTTIITLASGQPYPGRLAVDGTHVYWTSGGDVKSVPIGGGAITTLASGHDGGQSVAVDGTHVYWISGSNSVKAVPVGGGSVNTLVSGQYPLLSLAVDGTHVYFGTDAGTYPSQGVVKEVPVGGGPVNTVARGQANPGVAVAH